MRRLRQNEGLAKDHEVLKRQHRDSQQRVTKLENDLKEYQEEEDKRFEDYKKEAEEKLLRQKDEYEERIHLLEKDLGMCQKREGAIKAVFFREFEKERKVMLEDCRLRKLAKKVEGKTNMIASNIKSLEDAAAFCCHIKGRREHRDRADPLFDPSTIPVRALSKTYPFSYGNVALLDLDKYKPVTLAPPRHIRLMRMHDYYAGWLDAMRVIDHQKAIGLEAQGRKMDTRDNVLGATTTYLRDLKDSRNPRNTGINAGLLLAYSALCSSYDMPKKDPRLDVRAWDLKDLKPPGRDDHFGEFAFWNGVDYAVDKMKRLFELKVERGIWETGQDAAQIALMRTRDIKRSYIVVPRDVHRLRRMEKGDDTS